MSIKYNPFKTLFSLLTHPAVNNIRSKFGVLRRYFGWQIFCLFCNEEVIFKWIGKTKLKMKKSEAMITHNYYVGLYEYYDMLFLGKYLRSSDIYLDIGANSGVYSVFCSGVKNMIGLSYEPIPITFNRLQENIELNRLKHFVTPVNSGLSNKIGILSFTSSYDATNHVVTDSDMDSEVINVPVVTVDHEVHRTGLIPNFIKLDVEGFEKFVLEGAHNLLKNTELNIILIEMNESGLRYGVPDSIIFDIILAYGFKAYDYCPKNNTLKNLSNKSKRLNTIFIRDINLAVQRIESSNDINTLISDDSLID